MKTLLAAATVVLAVAAAPSALAGGLITENSASQNRLHQPQSYPSFSTENSAGQNQLGASKDVSGARFATENSASQNRIEQPSAITVSAPSGFSWADAGIGASTMFGAVLLVLGGVLVALRKRDRIAVG